MAKITEQIKDQIRAEYKSGASKKSLSIKYEVSIGAVFKICKDVSQENSELVKQQVAINTALSTQSETEVKAFHEIVKEQTKHLIFFQNRALANQKKADELLEYAEDLADVEAHSRITARNKDVVCGKEPSTLINNTNAQQTKITIERKEIK
ncbi:hypothetical protein [Campylobacter californiensis]|uniref:hypothetical protein n=1 Tax=Campylobacter californiensis TaxID=1032243 RepID=UPI0014740D66|nr:hypothetical protein [Campylobacter sp. RM12916]MBE3610500.1 hypothetical protein [Campylobacter sp. RM12916]